MIIPFIYKEWFKNDKSTLIFLIASALLAFGCSLSFYFVSDDFDFLKNIALSSHPWWYWFANSQNAGTTFYRPLHNLFFIIGYKFFGLNPIGYHAVIILLHTAVAWFWYLILRRLPDVGSRLALAVSLLFLWAPVQSESVAWITGGVSVLAALPAVVSLWCWVKARQDGVHKYYWYAILSWLVSLLAKESTIAWPVVILAADFLLLQSGGLGYRFKNISHKCIYWVGALAVYLLIRWLALGTLVGGYGNQVHGNFNLIAIGKMFVSSLIVFFSGGTWKYLITIWAYDDLLLFFVIVVFIWILIYKTSRLKSLFIWFTLVFVATLLPHLNLGINILTSEGERYLYLPSLGLAGLVVIPIWSWFKSIWRQVALAIILLLSLSLLVYRLANWQIAGNYTKYTLGQLSTYANSSEILVLLAPLDSFRGAFVWRNGLVEAILLKYPNIKVNINIPSVRLWLSDGRASIKWLQEKNKIIGMSNQLVFTRGPGVDKNAQDQVFRRGIEIESRYGFILAAQYVYTPITNLMPSPKVHYLGFTVDGLAELESIKAPY